MLYLRRDEKTLEQRFVEIVRKSRALEYSTGRVRDIPAERFAEIEAEHALALARKKTCK